MDTKVVQVDSPAAWPLAKQVTETRTIVTGTGAVAFKLRAISLAERDAIDREYPMPEPPTKRKGQWQEPDYTDPVFQKAFTKYKLLQAVGYVCAGWQPLPGKTGDERIQWVEKNMHRGGEVFRLFDAIHALSGFMCGKKEDGTADAVMTIESPEQWAKATEAPSAFTFERAGVTLRFTVKGVAGDTIKGIEAACDPGAPPMQVLGVSNIPGRKALPESNPNDPVYKKKAEHLSRISNMLVLQMSLGFAFPGADDSAKLAWIEDHPAGEVLDLLTFLRMDVLSYRSQVDF